MCFLLSRSCLVEIDDRFLVIIGWFSLSPSLINENTIGFCERNFSHSISRCSILNELTSISRNGCRLTIGLCSMIGSDSKLVSWMIDKSRDRYFRMGFEWHIYRDLLEWFTSTCSGKRPDGPSWWIGKSMVCLAHKYAIDRKKRRPANVAPDDAD